VLTHAGFITGKNILLDGGFQELFLTTRSDLARMPSAALMRHPSTIQQSTKGKPHEARSLRPARKPGIIDKNARIRDLSKVVKDINARRCRPPASPESRRPTSTSCRW
jgi:hypothetical protein